MRRPRIADLVKLAGVSRAAFYEHFKDKQECLLAAVDALVEPTIAVIEQRRGRADRRGAGAPGGRSLPRPGRRPAGRLEDGASSRSTPPGREGEAAIERALDTFERFGVSQLEPDPGPQGDAAADGPGDDRRLPEGDPEAPLLATKPTQLPRLAEQIADWGLSYPPPPGPLEAPKRRGRKARPFAERQAVAHPPERVLRALAATVAEKGYAATTVAEVVERAGTSQRVFYGHFDEQGRGVPGGARQRLGADAGHGPARLPPRPELAGVGAGRLRGDVRLRHRRARVHAGSARSRCTRSASGRCRPATRSWKASRRCWRPATSWRPTRRRSPPRRSAARSTR